MLNKCIRRYFFYLSPRLPLEKKNAWSQVNRWQVISVWMSNAMVNKTTLISRILKEHKFTAAVRKWEMLAATKEKMSGYRHYVKPFFFVHFIDIFCRAFGGMKISLTFYPTYFTKFFSLNILQGLCSRFKRFFPYVLLRFSQTCEH